MSPEKSPHISVMQDEVVAFFKDKKIRVFFDGTLGAGGHARAILEAHPEVERYIGCDRDVEALSIAANHLMPWKDKVELIHGNFANLDQYLEERKIKSVDGFFLISGCRLCN
jgi:16S rRNA (cytosine1402-N4)-methyltransferase